MAIRKHHAMRGSIFACLQRISLKIAYSCGLCRGEHAPIHIKRAPQYLLASFTGRSVPVREQYLAKVLGAL